MNKLSSDDFNSHRGLLQYKTQGTTLGNGQPRPPFVVAVTVHRFGMVVARDVMMRVGSWGNME
jgi:hypothetical protein